MSQSSIDRICGALLIALPVAIFTFIVADSQFNTYGLSFQESLRQVVDSSALFRAETVLLFISGLVSIALAAAMYLVFRTHERTLALFGAAWFLGLGMTWFVAAISGVALAHMADQFETATAVNASMIATSARPVQVIYEETVLIGMKTLFPLSLLTFGTLVIRSRVVPGWMGWMALVIGAMIPLYWVVWFIGDFGMLFGGLWYVLLGGWMIVRGTREAPPAPPAGTAPSAGELRPIR